MGATPQRWRARITDIGKGHHNAVQVSIHVVPTSAANFWDRDLDISSPPYQVGRGLVMDYSPHEARVWANRLLAQADAVEAEAARQAAKKAK